MMTTTSTRILANLDAQPLGNDRVALIIALKALEKVANCAESDCAKYVAKVDGIVVDALVNLECLEF